MVICCLTSILLKCKKLLQQITIKMILYFCLFQEAEAWRLLGWPVNAADWGTIIWVRDGLIQPERQNERGGVITRCLDSNLHFINFSCSSTHFSNKQLSFSSCSLFKWWMTGSYTPLCLLSVSRPQHVECIVSNSGFSNLLKDTWDADRRTQGTTSLVISRWPALYAEPQPPETGQNN